MRRKYILTMYFFSGMHSSLSEWWYLLWSWSMYLHLTIFRFSMPNTYVDVWANCRSSEYLCVFQLSAFRPVKTVAHVVHLIHAPVHHHGLVVHARYVSFSHQNTTYFPILMASSCLHIALSKWWNMHCSQHLFLYYVLGWLNMHNTYVEFSLTTKTEWFPCIQYLFT